ncbi:MAG: hypothetical protein JNM74_13865 [Myxococcales bacterium]|nr:hypothetical protein [Myxococcales bacterium]
MSFRLTALALGLSSLLGLVGCGGLYEEPVYPEPPSRQAVAQAPMPEAAPPPPPAESEDMIVGGDNDPETLYRETDPSALTEFKATLDPHGTWVDDDTYGTVWVPSATVVGSDFTPYVTAGRWAYDDGYVWVSDYEWGWAPFHYGRWVYIGGRGWAWIPGRVYRGAWVVWRTGPSGFGYVGWGPAPPSWYWRGGYAYGFSGGYRTPYYFCENRYVFQPQVGNRVVRGPLAGDIGRRTEPYVPADPRVSDARVAASPRVEGAPSAVAPQLRRGADGPAPASLGLEAKSLPRAPEGDKGIQRAYALGAPSTAVALGARAPSSTPRPLGALAHPPSSTLAGPARVGGTGPMAPDHPPVASAPTRIPPVSAVAPRGDHQAVPRMSDLQRSSPSLVEHHRSPAYSSSTYVPSRSTPSYSAPSFSAPSAPRASSPSFSAPSRMSSSPSFSAPSAPRASAPSFSAPSRMGASPSFSGGGSATTSAPRAASPRVRR